MKSFSEYLDEATLAEEAPANSNAGGGVDMNQNGGYKKRDKRKKDDIDRMYRRNLGLGALKKVVQ